jgi:DNA-binding transcriptional ArsR family regulator
MVQYAETLDRAITAVADPTRRGILRQLSRGNASISELATSFDMTLTGIKKHVALLEAAGLVTTEKVGRVRSCRVGPRRLDGLATWIAQYHRMLEERFDHLETFLANSQEPAE